jgi:hypothetical protein
VPLTVGVLIIGSLYWRKEGRERWRDWRLDMHHKWLVKAPIRYGRQSENKTYTMVFDSRLSEDQLGQAIVVQCKRAVTSASDLIAEAEWLWSAEEKNKVPRLCISSPEHRISPEREWGCVALLRNPNKEIPQQLLDDWAKHVAGEVHYHANERRSVNDQGILQIDWPNLSSDGNPVSLDLLLATANDQEPWPTYPTVEEIADAWSQHPKVDYFRSNRKHAIETFQDQEIEKLLR